MIRDSNVTAAAMAHGERSGDIFVDDWPSLELSHPPTIQSPRLPWGPYLLFIVFNIIVNQNAYAQQITDGGMKFTQKNRDVYSFSNSSSSGTRSAGSAAVSGGTINTGSASSTVLAELNGLTNSGSATTQATIAGNPKEWSKTLGLKNLSLRENSNTSTIINKGDLDEKLKIIMLDHLNLVETITKQNSSNSKNPMVKEQLTEKYDNLAALLAERDENSKLLTKGVHVINNSRTSSLEKSFPKNNSNTEMWRSGKSESVNLNYNNNLSSANDNIIEISSNKGSGTTGTNAKITVVGYSKNPNPNDGKSSSISAFATNNRTVGTIRVKDAINGQETTLPEIALQFGTTAEELARVNNLPNAETNIAGLKLVVPADLLTVDKIKVLEGETPNSIAKRFGISLSWLLELNGLTDPGQSIATGSTLLVPGQTKRQSVLPPAKPLAPELEYADYGAYTSYEVTYYVKSSQVPLFLRRSLTNSPR